MTDTIPAGPGRRTLFDQAAALAAGAIAFTSIGDAAAQPARAATLPSADDALRQRSTEQRQALGRQDAAIPVPPHPDNGDEARYPNKIGTDTRAIPHNERGEVDLQAYALLTRAYTTGAWEDFERIPLGGVRRFLNPVGSFAVNLTGPAAPQYAIPPAPALASPLRAAEAVELYWQSLLRDVPLHEYRDDTSHAGILAAVEELNRIAEHNGPKREGRVTPGTLFRGNALYVDTADATGRTGRYVTPPGVTDGPVVSQFLLHDAPYGSQVIAARIRPASQANDHLTDYAEWLRVQNGAAPARPVAYETATRFIATGRDLATYAHFLPASSWAASLLLSVPAALGGLFPASVNTSAQSSPYRRSRTQAAGASTFGAPYVQALVATGISHSIRIAYWQKYRIHRTLRPEAYAGLIHHRVTGNATDYPVHQSVLGSRALEQSRGKFGTHLLSHVYPEGSPVWSCRVFMPLRLLV